MPPKLSVVIPTYNRSAELARALSALVAQTTQAFDVVVCDDGSEEDIEGVVARYRPALDVQYVRTERSGGPARPRNVAISRAKGHWISFLDSDDWWLPERVQIVIEAMAGAADVIYHALETTYAPGQHAARRHPSKLGCQIGPNALRDMIVLGNPIPNSAAVVRRSSLERIGGISEEPSLVSLEDFDTWLRLAESEARFHFVDRVLGSYWLGFDSISQVSQQAFDRQCALFMRHYELFPAHLRNLARTHFGYRLGSMALSIGNLEAAKEHFSQVSPKISPRLWIKSSMKYEWASLHSRQA